jgi:DNA-binding NarL/FixJ family response regulator
MTNIFVIDDHPLLINGIVAAFKDKQDKIKIVGTAVSAAEALEKLKRSSAKVILLDLLMPGMSGAELCTVIKRDYPGIKIIAYTGETDKALLYSAWVNGADAILSKYCGKQEITETIASVLDGNKIIGKAIPRLSAQAAVTPSGSKVYLTKMEQRVLSTLSVVMERKKAAKQLGTSRNAIDFHCNNIFKKFGKIKTNRSPRRSEESKTNLMVFSQKKTVSGKTHKTRVAGQYFFTATISSL